MRCKKVAPKLLTDCKSANSQILIGKVNYMTQDAFEALYQR